MTQVVNTDAAAALGLQFRINRLSVPKTFVFKNTDDTPYSVAGIIWQMNFKYFPTSATNVFQLTSGSGLTITDNQITFQVSAAQSNISPQLLYWELYDATNGRTWICSDAEFFNRDPRSSSTTEDITVNLAADQINITVSNDNGPYGRIPLVPFATELTFDYDKDLATIEGGTTTFTLAADGHINGTGIIARINTPVAVNFPAGFEKMSEDQAIDTTKMNIITMRFFEDYDGAGNDKVLYSILNMTAV